MSERGRLIDAALEYRDAELWKERVHRSYATPWSTPGFHVTIDTLEAADLAYEEAKATFFQAAHDYRPWEADNVTAAAAAQDHRE